MKQGWVGGGRRAAASFACALLVGAALAAGACSGRSPDDASPPAGAGLVPASVYSLREGDLLFTYHALTDSEALFDLTSDPRCERNLVRTRTEDRTKLRRALEKRLGVTSLGDRPLPSGPRHF